MLVAGSNKSVDTFVADSSIAVPAVAATYGVRDNGKSLADEGHY